MSTGSGTTRPAPRRIRGIVARMCGRDEPCLRALPDLGLAALLAGTGDEGAASAAVSVPELRVIGGGR